MIEIWRTRRYFDQEGSVPQRGYLPTSEEVATLRKTGEAVLADRIWDVVTEGMIGEIPSRSHEVIEPGVPCS